jgi:hypothetical protein
MMMTERRLSPDVTCRVGSGAGGGLANRRRPTNTLINVVTMTGGSPNPHL